MFKLLGAFCIVAGCSYLGLRIASIYRKRTELFRFLQNGLTLLETEINYTSTPLPLALERVGQKMHKDCQPLFIRAATVLQEKKGVTAAEAWAAGVRALGGEVPLTKEETELLYVFGHGLGGSAKEEQVKNIALTRKQLSLVEKVAEEEQVKNQKLWQYLGFSLGAVIVLILI
ncbi:MAG: stage III sporulation protein AB [Clostridia bacterium]|jgi:stage III sporulation protein AB|nr:stage III sporulation protein AB [Clostridia bacterium]MDD4665414.1 stage III sporulation protein AB [Clostridia bacterium]